MIFFNYFIFEKCLINFATVAYRASFAKKCKNLTGKVLKKDTFLNIDMQ